MIIRHNKTFNGISLLIFAFIHITYNFTLFSVWLDDVNGPEYARSSETYFKDIRKSIVKINQLKAGVFLWRWKKKCVLWSWYITYIGGEKHVKIFFPKISGARKGAWTTTTATATRTTKTIGLNWQNNNLARASRFYVHFLAVTARLRRGTSSFHVLWRTWTQLVNDTLFLFL